MCESGYYPPGAEYDPRAPWNEKEPNMVKCESCNGKGYHWLPIISKQTRKQNALKKRGFVCPKQKKWPKPRDNTIAGAKKKPVKCAVVSVKLNTKKTTNPITMTIMSNPDTYYSRSEVSNSDLTELKNILHPRMQYGDKEAAFRFGSLVDAIITEPARVDYYHLTVDDVQYTDDEFRHAQEMHKSLRMEARKDVFLAKVLECAETQRFMVNRSQPFTYCDFQFSLDTRCKWDWWLGSFGGDLKTTFASTEQQFEEAVDFFDWDRSRAWYMDIAHSDHDFIYAISKKNCRVFKKFINRYDDVYRRGREKYEELAFQFWCLTPQT